MNFHGSEMDVRPTAEDPATLAASVAGVGVTGTLPPRAERMLKARKWGLALCSGAPTTGRANETRGHAVAVRATGSTRELKEPVLPTFVGGGLCGGGQFLDSALGNKYALLALGT